MDNPVLWYADSYRAMARQGVETVSVWSVITDLERNIAPLYVPAFDRVAAEGDKLRVALDFYLPLLEQVISERNALQQLLNVADERINAATDIVLRARAVTEGQGYTDLERDIAAFLKTSRGPLTAIKYAAPQSTDNENVSRHEGGKT
ncbi:hypothetical protein [Pseudomonas agarici]|uniref:hypothetical protein n=1 Tax=Pseudomonas agarici TaxID=46677 RepID=UPI001C4361BC|nr:hypothetical protein [Pseudomonas agarici]